MSDSGLRGPILIIEDDEDQSELLSLLFEMEGFAVLRAAAAGEALAILANTKVVLVICDLMLPGTDGIALVKQIRRQEGYERCPILMLTAGEGDVSEYEALEAGATEYCEKNVQRRVLLKRVENLLEL